MAAGCGPLRPDDATLPHPAAVDGKSITIAASTCALKTSVALRLLVRLLGLALPPPPLPQFSDCSIDEDESCLLSADR